MRDVFEGVENRRCSFLLQVLLWSTVEERATTMGSEPR